MAHPLFGAHISILLSSISLPADSSIFNQLPSIQNCLSYRLRSQNHVVTSSGTNVKVKVQNVPAIEEPPPVAVRMMTGPATEELPPLPITFDIDQG